MDRFIETYLADSVEREVPVSKLALELKHDLAVTDSIIRRKRHYTRLLTFLTTLTLAICALVLADIVDMTTTMLLLVLLQMTLLIALSDLLRLIHIDVLKSRLNYPELYTKSGRIYTRMLTHEKMFQEGEYLTLLGDIPPLEKEDTP